MNQDGSGEIGQGKEAFETVYELSRLLNTGLDRESLSILISLVEKGVNPEALAAAVKEIRRSSQDPPSGTGKSTNDQQFHY
ncbi:hypothetical protein, variant [Aphanomyces invadans]|uniref:Mitotic-spindle organizing protein 1 n=1 Tax=Aphanomyces invadans TaxID=157072 RepID=A0A024UBE7_9STRA|nr:hypothetical protein, variant [Aphanomyces invadans]ETW03515.1 hypothetical protein, variant [Aphanomyces invadans]|eukprot:XP_008867744.1 hypothetical protein, variant [Aphanomyces invadans]